MLLVQGAPGSPYTRKMIAALRYRHIPYRYISRAQAQVAGMPRPKVELLPTVYFPNEAGGHDAVVDSTPLLRRLEAAHAARPVLPPDPALAFFDALIEDYADEWLTKAMFHYRWHYLRDREKAGHILPLHHSISAPQAQLDIMAAIFTERQVGRLRYVGSNPTTGPVIEASYERFLGIFERLLRRQHFLFGARPAAADFAIFGQLSQLALFDPTPAALTLLVAPRVRAWVEVMEDMSGIPDNAAWGARNDCAAGLQEILAEIGRVYVPVLLANAHAIAVGAEEVEAVIDGQPWRQAPFAYHVKCLTELRRLRAALAPADASVVEGWLAGTGVERLFASA